MLQLYHQVMIVSREKKLKKFDENLKILKFENSRSKAKGSLVIIMQDCYWSFSFLFAKEDIWFRGYSRGHGGLLPQSLLPFYRHV